MLEDIGKNDVGDVIKERRNGNGARVYGANLDAKIAHGKKRSSSWALPRSAAATPARKSGHRWTART